MSIIVNEQTRLLVQGITGNQGMFHTEQMRSYGTKVVAGVTPGRGGAQVAGIPVYDSVRAALAEQPADASVLFTPAALTKDAALEAMTAGIKTLVIVTEHVPLHDAIELMAYASLSDATVIGPNTFGVVSPGKCKIGIPPNSLFRPGPVGVVARSGTLSYETVANLSARDIGQSTVIGIGGDRMVGLSFSQVLSDFEADQETKVVVLIGEIGGSAEEDAADYIQTMTKPVVAYITGKSAPSGKRMGHAGAIIERGRGSYGSKTAALRQAGARIATLPSEVPELVSRELAALARDPFYGLIWPSTCPDYTDPGR